MKTPLTSLAFAFCIAVTNTWAYDATADFNLGGNPNGVWSYGYSMNSGSQYAFVPFDTATATASGQFWTLSTYSVLGTPTVWKNMDPANTVDGVTPGQLSLHAGPDAASTAILRFTAPTTDIYSFNVQFFAGDIGNTQGSVILNGDGSTPWFSFASTNNNPNQSGALGMRIGDTFDVAVDKVGSYIQGNTPVTLSISAVPEPSSAVMWLLGLALMPACRRGLTTHRRLSGSIHQEEVAK
jgi:hypothetical protein